MMMDSPIDPKMWKYMFHTGAICMGGAILYSLFRQNRDSMSLLNDQIRLMKSKKPDDRDAALKQILDVLDEEEMNRKGLSRLAIHNNLQYFVRIFNHLDYVETYPGILVKCLKVIQRTCGKDPEGRYAFYASGGIRIVMGVLSEAHKHGQTYLMEEAAKTLESLTTVDEDEVVLPNDVPLGAEGAASMARFTSTQKMLRTLDPTARVIFLRSISGIYANICTLTNCAQLIHKGTDDISGASFFFKLLSHNDEEVATNAARCLRFLCDDGLDQHEDFVDPANINLLVKTLMRSSNIYMQSMITVYRMTKSPKANEFFTKFDSYEGINALFRIWVSGGDKQARDRAEDLIHHIERVSSCSNTVKKLMEVNRAAILDRKQKDEEFKQKQMQQAKQDRMLRQMMFQEMMGGAGGDMAGMMGEEE